MLNPLICPHQRNSSKKFPGNPYQIPALKFRTVSFKRITQGKRLNFFLVRVRHSDELVVDICWCVGVGTVVGAEG